MRASLVVFASCFVLSSSIVGGCATAEDSGGTPTITHKDGGADVSFDTPGGEDSTLASDSGAATDSGATTHDSGTSAKDSGTAVDSGTTTLDSGTTTTDSGTTVIDSGTVTTDSGSTTTDTAVPLEGGTSQGSTTGATCTSDVDCDVLGDGVQKCSSDIGFTVGPIYPSAVCVGSPCTPDATGASIVFCDGTAGVCLPSGTSGICLPTCTFDSTRAPSGCKGKDACNVYGWTTASPIEGIGYCFGGCVSSSDCPSGSVCQNETGLCVTTKVTYTKSVGTACTKADGTATPPKCNCLYNSAGNGYCSSFCLFGGSTSCGAGYTCDTLLPQTDASGGALFSGSPSGLAGWCLKTCTSDSDCTGLNSTCKQSAGVGSKTCQPF